MTPRIGHRDVAVVTGKRGGFGAMLPMLRAIRDADDLKLHLIVTDQHLSEKFGLTVAEIEREFSIAARVPLRQVGSSPADRARAVATCHLEMVRVLEQLKPSVLVLYGDRGEVLASALAAFLLRIPIAHLQAGDVSGSQDDAMRHAISRLATWHFASTEESAQRLISTGEQPWRVQVVGDHHLDGIFENEIASWERVRAHLDLADDSRPVIVLQHPDSNSPDTSSDEMMATLDAVKTLAAPVVVIYPCSDPGYDGIISSISKFSNLKDFRIVKNLDAHLFRGLLARAAVLVGNSSSGLIETPLFQLPCINIGERQRGRLHAENVVSVAPRRDDIMTALELVLYDRTWRRRLSHLKNPYGDGNAGRRVVDFLRQVNLGDDRLLDKILVSNVGNQR